MNRVAAARDSPSPTSPGRLPPTYDAATQLLPAVGGKCAILQHPPHLRRGSPIPLTPHVAEWDLWPIRSPPDVSRGANRAGHRRCATGQAPNPVPEPERVQGLDSHSLMPTRLPPQCLRSRGPVGGPEGTKYAGTPALNRDDGRTVAPMEVPRRKTLHTTPLYPPPPSIAPESRKSAPRSTCGSAGPSARSSPFRGWILRRTLPM